MSQLSVVRSSANTVQEHVDDHNEVHRLHNQLDDDQASNGEVLQMVTGDWAPVSLAAAGISATGHTHTEANITDLAHEVSVSLNSGATVGTRAVLNLIEGTDIDITVVDDAGGDEVDVTINSTASGGGGAVAEDAIPNSLLLGGM